MMSLTFGLFTQVSGSGPLGPLVCFLPWLLKGRLLHFFPEKKNGRGALIGAGALNGANTVC